MTLVTRTHVRRAAYFLAAPLVAAILFRLVPFTWFVADDFAWLGLPLEVHKASDFWRVLFIPKAQGTVRVLSERLFFLLFSSVFALNELPYRLWILGTWFADLTLASLIGARLTGSRAAGLLAAVFWTTSAAVATPLAWASAYNEVLCGFFILAAFYSRLRWLDSGRRRWLVAEWAAYLAGFGALELIVMYPALAALHALCTDRKRIWKTIPLFVPAVVFTIVHLFLVTPSAGSAYSIAVDRRLPVNFLRYLAWAIAPSQLVDVVRAHSDPRGLMIAAVIGVGLAGFVLWRVRRREFAAIFCFGWFVLMLFPVLLVPDHMENYYVTLPIVGLAWLGGWAIATAWSAGWGARALALILAGAYLVGSIQEIDVATDWYFERADRMRVLVFGVQEAMRSHPGSAFLLHGVDNDLFNSGFQDDPFRLLGSARVYLAPGTEGLRARADLGGLSQFLISPQDALTLLELGQARALTVSPEGTLDVTSRYTAMLRADPTASRHDFVDVGDPFAGPLLGPTWYPAEKGTRWMPKTAVVKLSGPRSPSAKLYVTGYTPAEILAGGPVTLHFHAAGRDLGSAVVRQPGQKFSLEFGLPAELVGQSVVEISVEVSKVLRTEGDQRELGMIFGTFGIR